MFKRIFIAAILSQLPMGAAYAQVVRELPQDELRANAASGKTKSLAEILEKVHANVDGEVVDVRAFDLDGIFFQILVMLPNGKLASVVMDAESGSFLPGNSEIAQQVVSIAKSTAQANARSAAKSNNGKANGKNSAKSNNGKSKGKSGSKGSSSGKGKK